MLKRNRGVKILFLTSLVILAAITTLSILNTRQLRETSHWMSITNEVIAEFNQTFSTLKDAETGQRGFIITGDETYLEPYNAATKRIGPEIQRLKELTADDAAQRDLVLKIESLSLERLRILEDRIRRRREGGFTSAQQAIVSGEGKHTMDRIRSLVAEAEKVEHELLIKREAEAGVSTTKTIATFVAGLVLSFALLLLVFYLLNHEISERKRAEESARHSAESLQVANKELEAFSYSTSHDLRAPLRHVIGFAELLQKNEASKLDDNGRRYLETIVEAAKRMGNLIDHLLTFSRLGRSELQMRLVDLDRLVRDTLDEYQQDTSNRKVKWKIETLGTVMGDGSLLHLVFSNLISNAIKFTRNCPQPIIEIGARHDKNELLVFVRDNGAGFDMKYADKLFGVFQRLHRAEDFEGTGIGLANVRRIIHRHGGRTWAEGALDCGATFYFSFPLEEKG